MKIIILLSVWSFVVLNSFSCVAASITGQVQVMKKGGRSQLDSSAYAVVYLTGKDDKPLISKAPDEVIAINQQGKRFFPRVMPIVKGQTVEFFNLDELDHNVFSTEKKNSFDLGRFPKGESRKVVYDQNGQYKVYCNIHQKMILDIVVLDNQYFAVSDEKGQYQIKDVPAGQYKLNFWHIYGGSYSQDIDVPASGLAVPLAQVVSTKVVREIEKHKNKHGKKYRKKGRYRR